MPVDAAHEALRKLPITELGAVLAVAIIDNARDREPISAVYGLLACAAAMTGHLSRCDQMLVACELHRLAVDMLPPEPRRKPMMEQNGRWIKLVK